MRVRCNVDPPLKQFLIEPALDLIGLLPRSLREIVPTVDVYATNPTDNLIYWKQDEVIGEAQEVTTLKPTHNPADGDVRKVDLSLDYKIPLHVQDLWERSTEHLSPSEQEILKGVSLEFEGVFARDEFDLGNFTDIVHHIDTGDAKPIKQKMRRTPMNFIHEENAHLNKMLSAGVIQPSISGWASPPVLVRKRDGGVRWCIDYRQLNSVTKKDVYPIPCIEE